MLGRRGLLLLGGATLASVAVAVLPGWEQDAPTLVTTPALPALAGRLDRVTAVRIGGGGHAVTLLRDGAAWSVAERDRWPADQAKVGRLLNGLARLRLVEAKTRRADLLARLGVEEPDAADAKSALVRVFAGDEAVAALIVGRRAPGRLGLDSDGTYVRRPDDPQAWLALGAAEASSAPAEWLDRPLAAIGANRVREVAVRGLEPEPLALTRTGAADDFVLVGAPADARYAKALKRNDIARFLAHLDLVDVRPDEAGAAVAFEVTWTTFDGMVLRAALLGGGDGAWLRLSASATQEARALMARWSGRQFRVEDSRASQLRVTRADVLEGG